MIGKKHTNFFLPNTFNQTTKNKTNHNSQGVTQINQRKNNRTEPSTDNNKTGEKNVKNENITITRKTPQKIPENKTQGTQANPQKGNSNYKIQTNNIINNAQNIQGRNADNKKLDNSTDEKNAGYKTTILPKRSEKKAD